MARFFNIMFWALLLVANAGAYASWTVRYQHTDTLGSVIAESNSQGSITQRFDYKPFGEGSPTQKSGLGYTGHLEDTDLGLTYMQQRYYDPVVGRFYSNDPVGWTPKNPVMSFNRYLYVNNNPYKYTDPNGEFFILVVPIVEYGLVMAGFDLTLGASIAWGVHNSSNKNSSSSPNLARVSESGFMMPGGGPGDDDNYENPGHHDPSGQGPNNYNSTKAVLPKNHQELFKASRKVEGGTRWTKVGSGKNTVYHRFSNDGNGNYHWTGSTEGQTARGASRAIKIKDVPNEVQKW